MIELKQVTKQYGQATVLKTLLCRLTSRDLLLARQERSRQNNPSQVHRWISEYYKRHDSSRRENNLYIHLGHRRQLY